eukprot:2907831-Ditylum_brightwellii.AAC.1
MSHVVGLLQQTRPELAIRTFPPDSIRKKDRKYMKVHIKYFDEELTIFYNLQDIVNENGWIYCEIQKGMYELIQAAILAYQQLKTHLMNHGYESIASSNGLWKHKTRKALFMLEWNYKLGYIDFFIAGYVIQALMKFQHLNLSFPQNVPHCWNQPVFGRKQQYPAAPNTSTQLDLTGQ